MTESDIRLLSRKIDTVIECVSDIKVDVAILSEKSKHAVDETSVTKIVKESLADHLKSCRGAVEGVTISGVNPIWVKLLVAAVVAAASAFAGVQLG